MLNLLLWWMLTAGNCIDTKPMTPTRTTWSNQNIIDWPVMLWTLQEQMEVLWRTPTTWLHAWPGMVRRPITSIARGEEWCGEAIGLQTSLQTSRNTQRLQAKRNKNDDLAVQCAWAQKSWWYLLMTSWCILRITAPELRRVYHAMCIISSGDWHYERATWCSYLC